MILERLMWCIAVQEIKYLETEVPRGFLNAFLGRPSEDTNDSPEVKPGRPLLCAIRLGNLCSSPVKGLPAPGLWHRQGEFPSEYTVPSRKSD